MHIRIFRQMSMFLVMFNNTVLSVPSKCIETNNVELRLRKFTKKESSYPLVFSPRTYEQQIDNVEEDILLRSCLQVEQETSEIQLLRFLFWLQSAQSKFNVMDLFYLILLCFVTLLLFLNSLLFSNERQRGNDSGLREEERSWEVEDIYIKCNQYIVHEKSICLQEIKSKESPQFRRSVSLAKYFFQVKRKFICTHMLGAHMDTYYKYNTFRTLKEI